MKNFCDYYSLWYSDSRTASQSGDGPTEKDPILQEVGPVGNSIEIRKSAVELNMENCNENSTNRPSLCQKLTEKIWFLQVNMSYLENRKKVTCTLCSFWMYIILFRRCDF